MERGPIVAPDAELAELFSGGTFTEGVAVAPDGMVYFCDAAPSATGSLGHIWRHDPRTGETTLFRSPSGQANGMKFDAAGDMVIVQGADFGGRAVVRTDLDTGMSTLVAGLYDGRPFNSLNDLAVDPAGRIYVTDPRYVGHEGVEQPVFGVYRVDPGTGEVALVVANTKPNGVAVSPDGQTLYVADHPIGSLDIPSMPEGVTPVYGPMRVLAYELAADGGLVSPTPRVIADYGSADGPDGMVTDAAGNLYVAVRAEPDFGIRVYAPGGEAIAFVPTPEKPTNVAFGQGETEGVLYVTAGGSLFSIDTTQEGWAPSR